MTLGSHVVRVLRGYSFRFVSESQLHEAIAAALGDARLGFSREVRLLPRDRIDFLVGRIGIEVKVSGSVKAVEEQLARYSESEWIDELVLVTACARHGRVSREINGKPVYVVATFGAF